MVSGLARLLAPQAQMMRRRPLPAPIGGGYAPGGVAYRPRPAPVSPALVAALAGAAGGRTDTMPQVHRMPSRPVSGPIFDLPTPVRLPNPRPGPGAIYDPGVMQQPHPVLGPMQHPVYRGGPQFPAVPRPRNPPTRAAQPGFLRPMPVPTMPRRGMVL